MTEQEVDYAVKVIRRNIHHEVPFEIAAADEELDRLSATLKSLIADGERLDWLEKNASTGWDEDSDGHDFEYRTSEWVTFADSREASPKTLRQAIDERRSQ